MNCFSKPAYVLGRRIYILDFVAFLAEWEGSYINKSLNTWGTFCIRAVFKVFLEHRGITIPNEIEVGNTPQSR